MKLGRVTKLYTRNKITSENFDDDLMSRDCDVIVIYLVYGQSGAIQKLDSGRLVCKTYIFINSNHLSYKNKKKPTKKLKVPPRLELSTIKYIF